MSIHVLCLWVLSLPGLYIQYEGFLPDLLQPGDIFMHHEASVHAAHIIRSLLDDILRIQAVVWPPYSPSLKPIEDLWAIMKGLSMGAIQSPSMHQIPRIL
jgi:hypothetical protein